VNLTRLVPPLLAILAAGCSSFLGGQDVCTTAGCDTGLIVQLSARSVVPFRVEAIADGVTRVFDCPDPTQCGDLAFFADFTPARVTVRVTTPSGTVAQTSSPSYATHRPNGDDCSPVCRTAVVRVALPA
jgi:hypothetical protein